MPDRVSIGIVHGQYDAQTTHALAALVNYDLRVGGRHLAHDDFLITNGGTDITEQRNAVVKSFLDNGTADWLLFLDTDEVWAPNLIDELIDAADAAERPIVSGLVMAYRPNRNPQITPACAVFREDSDHTFAPLFVPNVRFWKVATAGTGCLLIHRRVLEAIRAEFGEKYPTSTWFDRQPFSYIDDDGREQLQKMGEDYVFSLRAQACGFDIVLDTTIELGHRKTFTVTREMFHQQMAGRGERPVFVIIPVKDQLDYTKALVGQLREQGGYDGIFIYDNGSGAATKEWFKQQLDLMIFDARNAGIHDMWNAGVREGLRRSGASCDFVFLNNDLVLGHDFCEGLVTALRSGPWAAVCANYDGRDGEGVVPIHGICAERYDGTGGLAGFAFAARSEVFAAGYAFPTDCKWWYGDNDFTMTLDLLGQSYGLSTDVAVEHIGAGTAKDWSDKKWSAQLEADRKAFARKWARHGIRVG